MESEIKDHYNSDNLIQNIKSALLKAGKNLSHLDPKDLHPIDQLHTGGFRASTALFKKLSLTPDSLALDAGCGIGGSSRLLSQKFNCKVVGIDLAEKFIEAANYLTQCTRLDNTVSFHQGSVLDLPFEDNFFDIVLCQHILMNIKDKSSAIKEFYRVLKKDGKLLLHEITKGDNEQLLLPVPWASKDAISFLEPWNDIHTLLDNQGFKPQFYSDETHTAIEFLGKVKGRSQKRTPQPSPLNPSLIFGDNAKHFANNMHANFKNNSICLIEALLKKS